MKLKKRWQKGYTEWSINRVYKDRVDAYFYSNVFYSEAQAQAFIDERGPSYRGELRIVARYRKADWVYEGQLT